jgi:hypothetical protein
LKIQKKDWKLISQVLVGASVICVILAAVGYSGSDIWLASTQWLLVAAVLAVFGLYSRMNS